MSDKNLPRPAQATLAAWLVMLGSLFTVVAAWDQISGLRSLDTRKRVEKVLAEPPLAGSGIGLDSILDAMHVMALVTGAIAAAAVILGWHVLQRSKQARLVLTILAVPLFLTGMSGGGFWSSMAAVAVVLLWLSPTRDWFDGVAPAKPAQSSQSATGERDDAERSRAMQAFQAPARSEEEAYVAPVMSQQQPPPWTGPVQARPELASARRPGAVVFAAVLTWIGTGLTAAMMIASAVVATADPEMILEQVRKQAEGDAATREMASLYTADMLVAASWTMALVITAVCVAAAVFAFLALRRHAWARLALMITAGVCAVPLLLFALPFPPAAILFGAAVAAFSFLLRPEVGAWFRGQKTGR